MKVSLAFVLFALSVAAQADDASISFGGTPKLMSSHPSVRMVSEHIRVTIGDKSTQVDCTFAFQNDGPACNVRMGFPNAGYGAEETGYDEQVSDSHEKKTPLAPYNGFTSFKSFVDGKPAKVTLIGEKEKPSSWYTKTVSFAKGQRHLVRDTYTVLNGMAMTNSNALIQQFHYVMSTGASWKGPIGSVIVDVRFNRKTMKTDLKAVDEATVNGGQLFSAKDLKSREKGNVYYSCFTKPVVRGKTLRFAARNLEPTAKSDLWLYFDLGAQP